MLTLKNLDTGQTIALDAGLLWTDEFSWSPVEQSKSYAVDGTLIVESGIKQGGRPLTLSNTDYHNWCSYPDLLVLQQWCNAPLTRLEITLQNGQRLTVAPDCTSGSPLSAKPIGDLPSYDPGSEYHISLKLFEVIA